MNQKETGQLIRRLRTDAGFTQKTLAEALYVTDKAVSKWERGVCLPDSSLLSKLSMLLDADIEYLIAGEKPYGVHTWNGDIRIEDIEGDIAGKPILHYLLSYFLLVGITDINICTKNRAYVNRLSLEQFGVHITFNSETPSNAMILYEKRLLFGCNLTRCFQSFLHSDEDIIPVVDAVDFPILFSHHPSFPVSWHKEHCIRKGLGRGMVSLPLNEDAEAFIEIYERNSHRKIADLQEIGKLRGLI